MYHTYNFKGLQNYLILIKKFFQKTPRLISAKGSCFTDYQLFLDKGRGSLNGNEPFLHI
jgi:hypothetical protein